MVKETVRNWVVNTVNPVNTEVSLNPINEINWSQESVRGVVSYG